MWVRCREPTSIPTYSCTILSIQGVIDIYKRIYLEKHLEVDNKSENVTTIR